MSLYNILPLSLLSVLILPKDSTSFFLPLKLHKTLQSWVLCQLEELQQIIAWIATSVSRVTFANLLKCIFMLYLQTHQGGLTTEILKQRYTIIRVVCLITRQAAIHISFKYVCDHHLTTKQATIKDSFQGICLSWEFNRCKWTRYI